MADQPDFGETVLFCGHDEAAPFHLYSPSYNDREDIAIVYHPPDGGPEQRIRFVILCDQCDDEHSGDPMKAELESRVWDTMQSVVEKFWKN